MADSEGWSLTESDPGVFTGLLKELGVTGLEVEELWGLDMLPELSPVHALVFLFKWVGGGAEKPDGTPETPKVPHYFAQQVINNACATIAVLNACMNVNSSEVTLGEELENLKAFSDELDPETRGYTITNSEKIRLVHNSFARNDPFSLDEQRNTDEHEDAFHFISYMPIGDKLYELDGLQRTPISHGEIPGGRANWPSLAKEVLQRRIATYPAAEIHFNLLAITSRSTHLKNLITTLESDIANARGKGESDEWIKEQLEDNKQKLARIQSQFKEWEFDNALRRHNFVGLVHRLLLEMAKNNLLDPQIERATEIMKKKIQDLKVKGKTTADAMDED